MMVAVTPGGDLVPSASGAPTGKTADAVTDGNRRVSSLLPKILANGYGSWAGSGYLLPFGLPPFFVNSNIFRYLLSDNNCAHMIVIGISCWIICSLVELVVDVLKAKNIDRERFETCMTTLMWTCYGIGILGSVEFAADVIHFLVENDTIGGRIQRRVDDIWFPMIKTFKDWGTPHALRKLMDVKFPWWAKTLFFIPAAFLHIYRDRLLIAIDEGREVGVAPPTPAYPGKWTTVETEPFMGTQLNWYDISYERDFLNIPEGPIGEKHIPEDWWYIVGDALSITFTFPSSNLSQVRNNSLQMKSELVKMLLNIDENVVTFGVNDISTQQNEIDNMVDINLVPGLETSEVTLDMQMTNDKIQAFLPFRPPSCGMTEDEAKAAQGDTAKNLQVATVLDYFDNFLGDHALIQTAFSAKKLKRFKIRDFYLTTSHYVYDSQSQQYWVPNISATLNPLITNARNNMIESPDVVQIITHPQSVVLGSTETSKTFQVEAKTFQNTLLSYQWYRKAPSDTSWTIVAGPNISDNNEITYVGSTSDSLEVSISRAAKVAGDPQPSGRALQGWQFRCKITSQDSWSYSQAAMITVS